MRHSYEQRHLEKIAPRFYVIADDGAGPVSPIVIMGIAVATVLSAGVIASALASYMN